MPHNMYHLDPESALGKAMTKYSLAQAPKNSPISFVDKKISTDDMIFKRALANMYGLSADQMSSFWPTVQNTIEGIMPDGTIAKTNADIRLIKGDPLRTPTGVLEYKEDTPDENFPLKVPLESIKYDAESFLGIVDSAFEEYEIANIPSMAMHEVTSVNVLDNPDREEITDPEIITIDNRSPDGEPQTATEEFGDTIRVLTQINASGDLTGVDGTMFVIWKGFKYLFQTERVKAGGGISTRVGGANVYGGEQIYPPYEPTKRIAGLTNSIAGRNLEVFLKDRNLTYKSIEIVPKADIDAFTSCDKIISHFWQQAQRAAREKIMDTDGKFLRWGPKPSPPVPSHIKWGSSSTDGYTYNTNTLEYKDVIYEPGDIIKAVRNSTNGDKKYLPGQYTRWTEYHPHKTDKPANESTVYKPTERQRSGKGYEGVLVRGYLDGKTNSEYTNLDDPNWDFDEGEGTKLQNYFMIIRGAWHSVWPWSLIPAYQGNPPSKVPDEVNKHGGYMWNNKIGQNQKSSTVLGYHGNSYTVLNWDHMRYIGTWGSITRQEIDVDEFIDNTFNDPHIITIKPISKTHNSKFNGGDNESAQSHTYRSTKDEVTNHYFGEVGRFTWPYEKPGWIKYEAHFKVNQTKNIGILTYSYGKRGYDTYIKTKNDGKWVSSEHKPLNINGPYKTTKMDNNGGRLRMHKGDELHMLVKQNSSGKHIKLTKLEIDITVILPDMHDTVELNKEMLLYYGINSTYGGMVASANISQLHWRNYIKDGEYYDKPHLEKYNQLFDANKAPKKIKRTV